MSYKKILLIVPPFYRLLGSKNDWIHLGLHYIGANLNKHSHSTKIYNADANLMIEEKDYGFFFEEDMKEAILNSPVWTEISSIIKKYNPDLVGITMSSPTKMMGYKIAKIVKQIDQTILVVVGGPYPTLRPFKVISNKNIDCVVQGEGEEPFLKLVQGENMEFINGLVWKKGDTIQVNSHSKFIENLDSLPFPNFGLELIPVNPKKNFIAIQTARGCTFNCSFCSSPRIWGRRIRFRSVSNVIAEIMYRKDFYGVSHFYFSDDTFNIVPERVRRLCKKIIFKNLNITFSCEARLNLVDKYTLKLMKEAGCVRMKVGLESGNDRILHLMKKRITVKEIRNAIRKIKEVNIPITAYVMIGMPTETTEEMMDTLKLCKEINPDWVSLSIATPWYGTELYEMVKDSVNESLLFHQSKSAINKNVTSDVITEFLKLNKKKRREQK